MNLNRLSESKKVWDAKYKGLKCAKTTLGVTSCTVQAMTIVTAGLLYQAAKGVETLGTVASNKINEGIAKIDDKMNAMVEERASDIVDAVVVKEEAPIQVVESENLI